DLLTKAETEIRTAAQPRYHLEMALLRWIYLRKLTPIEDLIAGGTAPSGRPAAASASRLAPSAPGPAPSAPGTAEPNPGTSGPAQSTEQRAPGTLKDAFLAEIRKTRAVFYNMVVAQAQKIEVAGDRIVFTFSPIQRAPRDQFEQQRGWLESIAEQATGRKWTV